MYTLLHKKNNNFLTNSLKKKCEMYCTALINYFGFENYDHSHNKTNKKFSSQFCTFCVNFLFNDILLMHKTYRPSIYVFNIIFLEIKSTVTYCFYQLVEFSIKFPAIYVNTKIKSIENKKKQKSSFTVFTIDMFVVF